MPLTVDDRLAAAKPSFAVRRVPLDRATAIDDAAADLAPGDVLLARVDTLGQHQKIELPTGRRAWLHEGDAIIVAAGARYAPDQFEAHTPKSLGAAQLVAAGGIAGLELARHERMDMATSITLLGALVDDGGRRLNVADFALPMAAPLPGTGPVILVCGTSMNAGKTHSVVSLVRGLVRSGKRVAAIKATGTGAGGDLWRMQDAGAAVVLDFTDAGMATTFQMPLERLLDGTRALVAEAWARGAETIVMEVADGLCQAETAAILVDPQLRSLLAGTVFAAGDAMGAVAGVDWLQRAGHDVLAVSGLLTRSPLAVRETAFATALSCLTAADLAEPGILERLLRLPEPLQDEPQRHKAEPHELAA
jgi:hypothetical protein